MKRFAITLAGVLLCCTVLHAQLQVVPYDPAQDELLNRSPVNVKAFLDGYRAGLVTMSSAMLGLKDAYPVGSKEYLKGYVVISLIGTYVETRITDDELRYMIYLPTEEDWRFSVLEELMDAIYRELSKGETK